MTVGPSQADQRALALFDRYYDDARKHVDASSRVWADLVDAFLGVTTRSKPSGDDAWRSHVFIQYAREQIETLAAELAADDDATFAWEPRNPAGREFASTVEGLVAFQLERDRYPIKRLLSVMVAAIYGAQPVKTVWAYQDTVRPVRMTDGSVGNMRVVTKDQPSAVLVNPTDFAYDLRSTDSDDWRFAYHRMRKNLEELKAPRRSNGEQLYSNLEVLEEWLGGNDNIEEAWGETQRDHEYDYAAEIEKARREGLEVVEMWTPDRLIVVAARRFVIRNEPNPYFHGRIPFDLVTVLPSWDSPWGHSMMHKIRDVQEFSWTVDNASMDALKLSIDPPLVGDLPDDEDEGIYPGKHIRPGSQNVGADAIAPLRVTGMEHFASDAAVKSYLERMKSVTGITDEIAGTSQADSATQAAINQRQSKGRAAIMLRMVDDGWARVAEKFLQLDQQFLDHTRAHRVTGRGAWKLIAPEEIAGMWDARPKSASERVVAELDRQNKLEALAALAPLAESITPSGYAVDLSPTIRGVLEAFKMDVEGSLVPLEQKLQTQAQVSAAEAIMQQQMQAAMMPQELPPGEVPPPEEEGPPIEEEAVENPSPSTGRAAGQLAYNAQVPGA